jgi:hypothetical protein
MAAGTAKSNDGFRLNRRHRNGGNRRNFAVEFRIGEGADSTAFQRFNGCGGNSS